MGFKGLFKLSLAASVAVCANAAGESVLSGVEVTGMGGVQVRLMTLKFQPEMLVW